MPSATPTQWLSSTRAQWHEPTAHPLLSVPVWRHWTPKWRAIVLQAALEAIQVQSVHANELWCVAMRWAPAHPMEVAKHIILHTSSPRRFTQLAIHIPPSANNISCVLAYALTVLDNKPHMWEEVWNWVVGYLPVSSNPKADAALSASVACAIYQQRSDVARSIAQATGLPLCAQWLKAAFATNDQHALHWLQRCPKPHLSQTTLDAITAQESYVACVVHQWLQNTSIERNAEMQALFHTHNGLPWENIIVPPRPTPSLMAQVLWRSGEGARYVVEAWKDMFDWREVFVGLLSEGYTPQAAAVASVLSEEDCVVLAQHTPPTLIDALRPWPAVHQVFSRASLAACAPTAAPTRPKKVL